MYRLLYRKEKNECHFMDTTEKRNQEDPHLLGEQKDTNKLHG